MKTWGNSAENVKFIRYQDCSSILDLIVFKVVYKFIFTWIALWIKIFINHCVKYFGYRDILLLVFSQQRSESGSLHSRVSSVVIYQPQANEFEPTLKDFLFCPPKKFILWFFLKISLVRMIYFPKIFITLLQPHYDLNYTIIT